MRVSHGAQNGSVFHWENATAVLLNCTLLQLNHQCVNIVFTVGMSAVDFWDYTMQTAVLNMHSSKDLVFHELLYLHFSFLLCAQRYESRLCCSTQSWHRWLLPRCSCVLRTARCLRWSNEPCEQETATHAIELPLKTGRELVPCLWVFSRGMTGGELCVCQL